MTLFSQPSATGWDAGAIAAVRRLAAELGEEVTPTRFRVERVGSMSHDTDSMDVVLSRAVLHIARDASHWLAMVHEMWRVLAPGGVLFARPAVVRKHER